MTHLTKNKILTSVQHDFRARHSCESQLLLTTEDLVQNYEDKIQTDLIVLDFSKAFDVVVVVNLCFTSLFGTKGILSDIVIR